MNKPARNNQRSADRRFWLLLSTALLVVFGVIGMANAAIASLPTSPASAVPAASGTSAQSQNAQASEDPFVANFNCADISRYHIDQQMNIRASLIMQKCGLAPKSQGLSGPSTEINSAAGQLAAPLLGFGDADAISPDGTYPHIGQSETYIYGHGATVVVNYNDSRTAPGCYGGISYSTDTGGSWQHTAAQQLCSGHGTNLGDPIVVYDTRDGHWVAGDLATGCGGQGIGFWTSPDGVTWTAGACINAPAGDGDRESMYVDNNPASPNYGTMFVSYANYAQAGPPISMARSTDGGATWSTPANLTLPTGVSFLRNVQDTGGTDGTFYIAGMDEHGGGLNTRTNYMYHSTDGGATWSSAAQVGATFAAPGVGTSGYFAIFFPTIWRYMGWGQPAGGTGAAVGYIFTEHGAGSDPGDVYYARSTDHGITWTTAVKMNTDGGTKGQWQPSLASTATGAMLMSWYDGRNGTSASCGSPGTTTPCYERWGRVSTDNGATWQPDANLSSAISGLPAQPDGSVQPVYEGDYDYASADGTNTYTCWNDGRNVISSNSQQDVFCDRVAPVQGTPTPTTTGTPATPTRTSTSTSTPSATPTSCAGYSYSTATATIVPGVTDIGNHTDDGSTLIALPFPVNFYGQTFTNANVGSNGDLGFTTVDNAFTNVCLPDPASNYAIYPLYDDQCTGPCSASTCTGCGIYTSVSGTAPNRIFNIEWRTNYYNTNTSANYEVRLYENSPTHEVDVIYGALNGTGSSATVGVQKDTGSQITQVECNTGGLSNGEAIIFTQPSCGTPTSPPTNTPTITPIQPTPTSCALQFSDVPPGSTFYPFVHCLACLNIINGYSNGTFKPGNPVTRGQLSKIVSNSAGFQDTQTTQMFQDVPVGSTFFQYIGRLASRGYISGYTCGGPGEPCIPPANLPYFRTNANATRGQISKIVSNAAGFADPPTGQQFQDVPVGSTYYTYTYRLVTRGVMSGYPCGSPPAGPCVPPANLPYFRPNNNATRGQTSKIDANTFFPDCNIPDAATK